MARKLHPRLEPLTATLARKAHRPVQWVLTREEVFLTAHCQAAVVKIKTGVKKDGTIVARQVEGVYDTGAYALTSTDDRQERRGSIGWAVSDSASGFDDVLRVHEHAADGAVSRVWGAAGMLGV